MAIIDNDLFTQTNPNPESPRNNPSLAGQLTNLNNEVSSIEDTLVQGYVRESASVSYVSSSSFTVSSDVTAIYTNGRIVRFSDGTTGIVSSSSYSAPNTTVTLLTGTVPSDLSYVDIAIQAKGKTSGLASRVLGDNNVAVVSQKDSGGTAKDVAKIDSSNVLTFGNTTTTTKIKAGSNTTNGHTVPNVADDTFALLSNLYNSIYRQALINGAFDVWQRGTSFTPNDDTYTADRWTLLTETNGAWTIARNTDVPDGFTYSAKLSNVIANNQVALVQFIENINAKKFQNKKVSLSFYAKTIGNEIANLRAAVLSWTGTADSLTSDVIATWAQDGNNPTWATNWTMENTPTNLALTSSYQQFKIENINIDTTGMTNLAVVIWVDDGTITSGDDFYITGIQLNVGEVALPFQPKSFDEELRACLRYYEKSFPYQTAPANNAGYQGAINIVLGTDHNGGLRIYQPYKVKKRIITAPSFYNPGSGTPGQAFYSRNGASGNAGVTVDFASDDCWAGYILVGAAWTVSFIGLHWAVDAEL
jgi:hypothetical protein